MRRLLAVGSSAALILGLVIGAIPQAYAAASPSTVTLGYSGGLYSLSATEISANAGDTFTFTNNVFGQNMELRNGTGSMRVAGTICQGSDCTVTAQGGSVVVTVVTPGTFTVNASSPGTYTATITVSSASSDIDLALVYPTATIDANGGTCTGSSQFIKAPGQNASSGTLTAPSASSCTRTNYVLRGWALSATATTIAFPPGSTVPIGAESFTLFGVWSPVGVEIRYNANVGNADRCLQGASNVVGDARQSAPVVMPAGGAVATAAPCTPVDARLVGWALTGDGQSVVTPGAALPSSLAQGSSHVLYAKWQVAYGLTSSVESVSVRSGEAASVTLTATLNGAPAAGRSVEVAGVRSSIATSSASSPAARVTAITNGAGQVTVTVRPTEVGEGAVSASFGNVSVVVPVTTIAEQKTMTIIGSRGTVSGKPGIIIDGQSTGFAAGEKVVPYLRFPGQTTFSAGSARPEVGADGSFSWQRKTGKKAYVYFTSEDGTVTSNRVIVPAV